MVLLSGSIGWEAAWRAIDWEVIGFLFGVFVLGQALTESGSLARARARLLGGIRSADGLVLGVPFGSGIDSALLMNDTLAVIGTPLTLLLALTAGSTIAGNLTRVGAASNVIVAQAAERQGEHRRFWRFLAVGAPLTGFQLLVYWLML